MNFTYLVFKSEQNVYLFSPSHFLWYILASCWLKYPNCNASVIIKVKELLQTFRNLLLLQLTTLFLISLSISCLKYPFFYINHPFSLGFPLNHMHMFIAPIPCFLCRSLTFLSTVSFTSFLIQITYTTIDCSNWINLSIFPQVQLP